MAMTAQIADPERQISALYDMLDYQDATNRDGKGLPFTVSILSLPIFTTSD
jgi:hypothetical protein